MTPEQLKTIRLNVLNAPASVVESNRDEIQAALAHVVAEADKAKVQPEGYFRAVDLRDGCANAPLGSVYHLKLQLLEAFGVLDQLDDRSGKTGFEHYEINASTGKAVRAGTDFVEVKTNE